MTAAGLLPALRAAVSEDAEQTTPQLDRGIAIATALWQIDGDAEEAVTILASVLDRTTGVANGIIREDERLRAILTAM
ncbi:hypothetical protein [Streptomyces sp. Isolate_45]|uniref:hypothetical protein n=1 Tax=Streptomyces sp. Isolate_45 TaxID=2950111 RepID=UPI002481FD13|nr:hypothetical protein [Streptomyces sp. Isolate_45]MDA5281184.1 hypothetical protein [Streptomyces sp. Isolate_45]